MWLKLNLVLLSIVIHLSCSTHTVSFEFTQLAKALDSTLKCLEKKYPNLSSNATYGVAYGLCEMPYIPYTVPNLPDYKKNILKNFEDRMDAFLKRALQNFPDDVVAQTLWYPQYWSFTGVADYRFKRGRIPKNQAPLGQTLSEIYERSVVTPDGFQCYVDFVTMNGKSATPRECKIPCTDVSYSPNFDVGFTSEIRWVLIGAEFLLNCTNNSPQFSMDKLTTICSYEKQQVDALFEMRYEEQFQGLRYYFLNKIMQCGVAGYPELFRKEVIAYIIGTIGCDGCVGTDSDSDDVKQVLTARTAAIISEAIRLIEEERNGLPYVD